MLAKKKPKLKSIGRSGGKKQKLSHKRCEISVTNFINALFGPALVLDENLKVIRVNDSFCKVFQTRPQEVCGKFVYELGNHAWDMPILRSLMDKVLSGVPAEDVEAEKEFPLIGKRVVRLRSRAILDGKTDGILILVVIEDITARKEMGDKLEHAVYEWRRTFDSITDQVMLLDAESKIVRANKAFFDAMKAEPQALLGKKCYELLHETDHLVANCPFRCMLKDKKTHTEEVAVAGGKPFLVTVSPVVDDKQNVVGAVHIARDIAERKQAEERVDRVCQDLKAVQEQLVQSEKLAAVGQLVAGVAHEINNPVGFVSGNLEVLRHYVGVYLKMLGFMVKLREAVEKKAWSEVDSVMVEIRQYEGSVNLNYMIEDAEQLLQQSQDGIGRIEKIVWDLRTFALEEPPWREDTVNIEEVLETVLGIMCNELKNRIEIQKNYGDTPLVRCNKHKMEQVFMNLLINASQAIQEKGIIKIITYTKDGNICVDINDNGCGIPPENMRKIFDPFFSTKKMGAGTGLGLSISHDILRKQGGEICVASVVGKGATFTVKLPLPVEANKKS